MQIRISFKYYSYVRLTPFSHYLLISAVTTAVSIHSSIRFYSVLVATFRDHNFRLISSEMKKIFTFMMPHCQFLFLLNRTKFQCLYALFWLYTTDGHYCPYGHRHHEYLTRVIFLCCPTIIYNSKGKSRTKAESNTALVLL